MPIHKMSCEDGVFTAKTVGYFDSVDGRMWANALRNYAKNDLTPLVAIVDMSEVNRICPTVIKAIVEAARTPNLQAIAVVLDTSMASQNARLLDKLMDVANLRVYYSRDEAQKYLRYKLNAPLGGGVAYASYAYAFAY